MYRRIKVLFSEYVFLEFRNYQLFRIEENLNQEKSNISTVVSVTLVRNEVISLSYLLPIDIFVSIGGNYGNETL